MKIMLKRDTDLKDLETKVNENLAALEADGAEIMGIEHGTETLPVIRGKEIADYRTSYTVMIVYEPSRPGGVEMNAGLTLGSLFDGIAGFPLAAGRHGIKTVWTSEIEPNCIDIAGRHFPDAVNLGDITGIKGGEIPVVDIISFGSPCQDLSVAGKQTGLDGSRSGLFMEAVRIIREMREKTDGEYPKYIIWENVAGAFSSNKGEDFRRVLEEITEASIPMPTSGKWASAGLVGIEEPGGICGQSHGGSLTHSFGEFPNVEKESTLSQILEMDVPDKYFLSAKACWGILSRAEKREKEVPTILKIALLERIAEDWQRNQADK